MEDKQMKLVVVHADHRDYESAGAAEILRHAEPPIATMIRGLVQAAEILESRELDIGHREIWDSTACGALQDARTCGWCISPKPLPKPRPLDQPPGSFSEDLERLINKHCMENGSNTPDYVLASYLQSCLDTWNKHVLIRDKWHGVQLPLGFEKPATGPA